MKIASFVFSIIALLLSIGGFAINYSNFRANLVPPEIFVRLNSFELTDAPLSVAGDINFSISNPSSRTISFLSCSIATNGLNTGAGGFGEQFKPCSLQGTDFDPSEPLEIGAGQTIFLRATYKQDITSYDAAFALNLMGYDLAEFQPTLQAAPCRIELFSERSSGGMNQNCPFMDGSGKEKLVFQLVLQTALGEEIRRPVHIDLFQAWPWASVTN